jgi:hypothetical protein
MQRSDQSGRQFIQSFEGIAHERQGAQLFLPPLNQVEPTCILGNVLYTDFRPSS